MRFGGFVLAVNHEPEPQRGRAWRRPNPADADDLDYGVRSGLAFEVLTAPRVNAPAWFALAVAAPLALLALATAMTKTGIAQAAGLAAAALLAPAIVLALRSLERRGYRPPAEGDPQLNRAFALTTGQACGLLFVVIAGAPFSGQSVAVGLAMAGMPLATALVAHGWRRLFRPVGARTDTPVVVGRDWLGEWAEAERRLAPEPVAAPVLPFPARRKAEAAEAAEPAWTAPKRRAAGRR